MGAFGVDQEAIDEAVEKEREADAFEVHPDNDEAVGIFLSLQTQWRVIVGGMGGVVYQGFDYASIPATLELLGIDPADRGDVFASLRIMEAAALPVLNEKPDE